MVEDVATDATGDCFGEYVRVWISIDIMKRLKKVIRIQQKDRKEILVGVTYEKLPDYCFSVDASGITTESVPHIKANLKMSWHTELG